MAYSFIYTEDTCIYESAYSFKGLFYGQRTSLPSLYHPSLANLFYLLSKIYIFFI